MASLVLKLSGSQSFLDLNVSKSWRIYGKILGNQGFLEYQKIEWFLGTNGTTTNEATASNVKGNLWQFKDTLLYINSFETTGMWVLWNFFCKAYLYSYCMPRPSENDQFSLEFPVTVLFIYLQQFSPQKNSFIFAPNSATSFEYLWEEPHFGQLFHARFNRKSLLSLFAPDVFLFLK